MGDWEETFERFAVSGPSPEALATWEDLRKRWDRIEADLQIVGSDYDPDAGEGFYGIGKVKEQRKTLCLTDANRRLARGNIINQHSSWVAFRETWLRGNEDTTQLQAQVSLLTQAEKEINDLGGCIEGAAKPAPDVTQSTDALKAASSVDAGAKAATNTAKDAVKAGGKGLADIVATVGEKGVGTLLKELPWWAYAAGGTVLLIAGVSYVQPAVRAIKSLRRAPRRR